LTLKEVEKPHFEAEPFIELRSQTIAKIREAKLDGVIARVGAIPGQTGKDMNDAMGYISELREIRNALREQKQYQLADEIRTKLEQMGVSLRDTSEETVWKRKR
jgi:cysteinyl-tRNA synthetase